MLATWFQKTNSDSSNIQEPSKLSQWLTGLTTLTLMGLVAWWALPSTEAWVVYRTDLRQIPLCGVYFMVGACLFQFKLNKYFSLPNVVLAVLIWLCFSREPQLFAAASWVVLPFVVLAFGLSHHAWLSRWHERDYSYGIYIYAFPVQQTVASIWPSLPLSQYVGLVGVCTLALAAASWHWVEKPALSFKPTKEKSQS
jgi:peptidoglycan/LPS O-acetylase OafA/YrhL